MNRFTQALVFCAATLIGTTVWAQDAQSTTEERILEALEQARPGLEYQDIRPSPIDGLYQVSVSGGPVLYVTPEGDKMIAGEIFSIEPGGFAKLEDPVVLERRRKLVKSLEDKNTINFAPEGDTKAVVYVFTDVDCGFCRRLHSQMHQYRAQNGEIKPGYNDLGIEVRYLAFPRAGLGSPAAKKLETAWCSDNPQEAMNRLKSGESLPLQTCDKNPVPEQYSLGGEVGVRGTPALLLPSGQMQAGYLPPEQLAQVLGLNN